MVPMSPKTTPNATRDKGITLAFSDPPRDFKRANRLRAGKEARSRSIILRLLSRRCLLGKTVRSGKTSSSGTIPLYLVNLSYEDDSTKRAEFLKQPWVVPAPRYVSM